MLGVTADRYSDDNEKYKDQFPQGLNRVYMDPRKHIMKRINDAYFLKMEQRIETINILIQKEQQKQQK